MACDCLIVTFREQGASTQVYELNPVGQYLGFDYFEFPFFSGGGGLLTIWYNEPTNQWVMTNAGVGSLSGVVGYFDNVDEPPCAIGEWTIISPKIEQFIVEKCVEGCTPVEDRIFRQYASIRLPRVFEEEDRGFARCCCVVPVLASSSSDTWKNDKTSAWIKLSSLTDIAEAKLYKDGIETTYSPTAVSFVNEPFAFYWTINWNDVLNSDGAGCYTLKISYDISGVQLTFTWGIYELKPFTTETANFTARVRAFYNDYNEVEQIDFTNSMVEDSCRFYGFIGNRQPNMITDNLIYQNREMKKVIRENLNTYEIITDPTCEGIIRKLTDNLLLSENELFLSDYNAANHSYRFQDLPAIVENSPEITYYEGSREASLKCVAGDKFKDQRTYYR
jgi:hypothetical protein